MLNDLVLSIYNNMELQHIYQRRQTTVVHIGNTSMGSSYPIRIQSMANVSTMDTDAAVEQAIRMIEAGAEYIRFTAQGEREARNLGQIRQRLNEKGYRTPLVADIHFNPKVAEVAAEYVEKVRINPGNFIQQSGNTDKDWETGIRKIRERFIPFLTLCRKHQTAIRIGVNHGSLSNRIMQRYGDTPEGMVESCMEFLRICKETAFDDVVISVKASNTVVMVKTVRLLVQTMQNEGMQYPLHLGVTEAGDEEDGRIKSAVGIGALLIDGIGDTIRVSLSEPPEAELPVARKLVDYILERDNLDCNYCTNNNYKKNSNEKLRASQTGVIAGLTRNLLKITPQTIRRVRVKPAMTASTNDFMRQVRSANRVGGQHPPVVISDRRNGDFSFDAANPPDFLYIGADTFYLPDSTIPVLIDIDHWHNQPNTYPYFYATDLDKLKTNKAALKFLELTCPEPDDLLLEILCKDTAIVVVLKYVPVYSVFMTRRFVRRLLAAGCDVPLILRCDYQEPDQERFQIKAAVDFGTFLIDGIGSGLFLCNEKPAPYLTDRTMFSILQATRLRISKTEYISCPGCGRTLYDLQTTIARIKEATSHLKGLKIGIMGCIVNGPGEMADADYGYVGAGRGRISLYKGKECVQKNIPEAEAVEQLIYLIKMNGDWKSMTE